MIRPFTSTDSLPLSGIRNHIYPQKKESPAGFQSRINRVLSAGGFVWVMEQQGQPIGYVESARLPGLDGVGDLQGFIGSAWQHQGLGTRLLNHMLTNLKAAGWRQISTCVPQLDSPLALFLQHNHFFVEHEECTLRLDNLVGAHPCGHLKQDGHKDAPLRLQSFRWGKTTRLFQQLYNASFSPQLWYQPYSISEIEETLDKAADIQFLMCDEQPIGFAWVQTAKQSAIIEPVGIVPQFQGHGHGRFMLTAVLHQLAQQNINQVEIGAWKRNGRALSLYQSLGFRPAKTAIYLAINL